MNIERITIRFVGNQGEPYGNAWPVFEVIVYHEGGPTTVTIADEWGLQGFKEGLKLMAQLHGLPAPPEPMRIR